MKYYAVRVGKTPGIYTTWEECKPQVYKFPGAIYKSFDTKQEAEQYMSSVQSSDSTKNTKKKQKKKKTSSTKVTVFVDGSFSKDKGIYSFGAVFILPNNTTIEHSGNGNDSQNVSMRNVAGEISGAVYAVNWAMTNKFKEIEIHYDYSGIEQWATDGWKAKTEQTQKYAKFMKESRNKIKISFVKVKGHTGVFYNEKADKLAKSALEKPIGIDPIVDEVHQKKAKETNASETIQK